MVSFGSGVTAEAPDRKVGSDVGSLRRGTARKGKERVAKSEGRWAGETIARQEEGPGLVNGMTVFLSDGVLIEPTVKQVGTSLRASLFW